MRQRALAWIYVRPGETERVFVSYQYEIKRRPTRKAPAATRGARRAGGRGARSRAARTAQARRRPRAHNLTIKRTTSIVLELLVKGRRQLRSIVQTQSGGQIEPQVVRAVVLRPE